MCIRDRYCDGRRVSCPNWLTQWGSKSLGEQGFSPIEILRYYYGDDMYILSLIHILEKARAEGHLLFINTGRTICSIPTEVRKFQFDGYLCGCGTYLTEHDEVLLKSSIEKQRGIELLRKAKECNLGVIAEGQEDCYFPGHISRFDRLESTRRYFASRGIGIEQSLESERFEYDKLFVYVDDKSDFDSFREYLGDDMEALDRGGKAYEVIQKGFSKATACQFIMERCV